jgi:hypothetical protein
MSRAFRPKYEHFQWCPVDFNEREPTTDPATAQRAKQLSDELQTAPQPGEASAMLVEGWELNLINRCNISPAWKGTAATPKT